MSFHSVLIANRGEIACRIAAACRYAGLTSIAVYSDADAHALHVRAADRSVHLGPAEAQHSYLNIEAIVDAARRTGADAVHPGYGFLAERAALADACTAAGLTFIGPRAEHIRQMGDKRAARAMAVRAGVPVVPGIELADDALATAQRAAREVGYPVLVKAALGGGGKGMKVVEREGDLADAIESARRVAASAFGDASVYLERYLPVARHIEVQVLGDGRGNAIHLFERECSLQRRHQKLLEETPSVALDDALRARITAAAVAFARELHYASAGTCEFLLAPDGAFYFLEMNTRIQVEHPVTEMTTGCDLVAAQLSIARTGALPFAQADVTPRGTAVEVRLYAEDPSQNFLPQAGRIQACRFPSEMPFVRVDAGVDRGSDVPVYYDPMLAKIIAWGATRADAYARLRAALDATVVHGIATNLPVLRFLAAHPRVEAGDVSTSVLEAELLPAFHARVEGGVAYELIAAAAIVDALAAHAPSRTGARGGADDWVSPFTRLGAWRVGGSA